MAFGRKQRRQATVPTTMRPRPTPSPIPRPSCKDFVDLVVVEVVPAALPTTTPLTPLGAVRPAVVKEVLRADNRLPPGELAVTMLVATTVAVWLSVWTLNCTFTAAPSK